ncbi:MAG TPA: EAL domain-containing protein [Ideonella sp.]|nr:EAL domain-containing protein [Ideonella sp.]
MLARLSVGRKLMLIYLLDLTAVIYISGILINEKFIAIDFARKEVAGNAYIAAVRGGLVEAARIGSGQPADSARLAAGQAQLRSSEAQHGAGMQAAALNERLQRSLQGLGVATGPVLASAGGAIDDGRQLITRVGNQSNLILDPDLDSYYTMSLVLLRYPELLELLHGVGSQLHQPVTGDTRTRYLILEGRLDAAAKGVASDYAEALAAGGAPLQARLDTGQQRLMAAIEAFRGAARGVIDEQASAASLAAMDSRHQALLVALDHAWSGAAAALDHLLLVRIDGLFMRMWLHLGTALTLLGAILAMVYFVARQIAAPLRHLSSVTETVRLTGDHTLRAEWHSQDEIGRLVVGFNDMLAQLDREREAQKELAASARAAEAQHALVEATPMPMMVTAVPGHEVLHANQPAQAWLGGRSGDPWAAGLESPVRSRFFQQLADRGAVDEFEVRWQGGAEPVWAVLSARRLSFQGRDAILTAFAPINHLKLMEQRLELWAKVFEASFEGIMIVDAGLRVISVNRALSRSTGQDVQDLIGEPPELLLAGPALPTLWQQVRSRGAWQGELGIRRRDGSEYPAWLVVSAVREAQGELTHFICTSIDITDRKKSEARIEYLAHYDVLTGLPNRALCLERLRMALQQAGRAGHKVAVLFLDLDRFKNINDSLGHHMGDGLLRSVARRLGEAVRGGDTVSRLGGDEFIVVLNGVEGRGEAALIAEQRLVRRVREPHQVEGTELHVSCSIGIALFPDDAQDVDDLVRHADVAMYQAKAQGRDGSRLFSAEMTQRAELRQRMESALRRAIEQRELSLQYQPRIDAASGELAGVEGLLRWHSAELGAVSPAQFIPVAEESGLIVGIGAWVIEEACAQVARWRDGGLGEVAMSINLSALQLRDERLLVALQASMQRHQVGPGVLELEITESTLMESVQANLGKLQAMRGLGVGLSIDDFGTGYSSLNYLNRFPLDKLKIDRSFVSDMLADPSAQAIVKAIIGLGHALGLRVVAEGVEQAAELALLHGAGCDEFQGYHFARPMPAEALPGWLASGREEGGEGSGKRSLAPPGAPMPAGAGS